MYASTRMAIRREYVFEDSDYNYLKNPYLLVIVIVPSLFRDVTHPGTTRRKSLRTRTRTSTSARLSKQRRDI
eukprot:scaffold497972_cov14-Prasinocladus_malaysianus.AAC.1